MELSHAELIDQIVTRHREIYECMVLNKIDPLDYMWTLDKYGNTLLSWIGNPELQESAYRRIRACTGIFVLREVSGNLSGLVVAVA